MFFSVHHCCIFFAPMQDCLNKILGTNFTFMPKAKETREKKIILFTDNCLIQLLRICICKETLNTYSEVKNSTSELKQRRSKGIVN